MLANMYLSKDQPMKYFVATMRCDQFDSLDKILTETKVNMSTIFLSMKTNVGNTCKYSRLKSSKYSTDIISVGND